MPMRRNDYPADWDAIAFAVKVAADWRCRDCGMQCRRPGEPFDTHRRTMRRLHTMKPYETWRATAQRVIMRALREAETKGLDADATRAHVNAAYPFGERAYHPYKIWLSEMKRVFRPNVPTPSDLAKLQAWNEGKPISVRSSDAPIEHEA